jgi:hypothetical protein
MPTASIPTPSAASPAASERPPEPVKGRFRFGVLVVVVDVDPCSWTVEDVEGLVVVDVEPCSWTVEVVDERIVVLVERVVDVDELVDVLADALVEDLGTVVLVVVDLVVDVLGIVVVEDSVVELLGIVVEVVAQSDSSWCASACPCGCPSNDHWSCASTVCVPDPTEIDMTSVADGPSNVKSRVATSTLSILTDSCDLAVTSGKLS